VNTSDFSGETDSMCSDVGFGGDTIDELSTTEEEPMTESESSEKLELDPMNKDTNLIDDTNVMLDSTLNEVADNATPSLPQGIKLIPCVPMLVLEETHVPFV
jgi:hypothetical protein